MRLQIWAVWLLIWHNTSAQITDDARGWLIASQEMLPNPELRLVRKALANPQPILPDPTLPVAVPVQQPVADDSVSASNTAFTSAPAAAADEDLIEKNGSIKRKK